MLIFLAILFVLAFIAEKLFDVKLFKPINKFPKLLMRIIMWVANDGVGNALGLALTKEIASLPDTPGMVGVGWLRPFILAIINIYFIYEIIKDIREYTSWIKNNINIPRNT